MHKTVIVASHAVFTPEGVPLHGAGSSVEQFLKNEKVTDFLYIKNPIVGSFPTHIDGRIDAKPYSRRIEGTVPGLLPVRYAREFVSIYKTVRALKRKMALFIGIDPLNALYGITLKRLGLVDNVIFYTADYAVQRFENPVMNAIYHAIDRHAAKHSERVWNVSSRITDMRTEQGLPSSKNRMVPNSPAFDAVPRLPYSKIRRKDMVIVSSSPTAVDMPLVFNAVARLKEKHKDMRVIAIGMSNWGDQFSEMIQKLRIEKNVMFSGSVSHAELQKILCASGIGLALYTNQSPWSYYSDSMKVRDYLACGLPTLVTDVTSTAKDVKESDAGYVVNLTLEELVSDLDTLLTDEKVYKRMREHAIELARKYDIKNILDTELRPFIS